MRLKDVSIVNAKSLDEATPEDYTFKYIDISSVSSDSGITLGEDVQFIHAPSRARRIVRKGDVLISTVRTYLRAIADIDWDAKNIIASTGFAVFTPNWLINPRFLAYASKSSDVINQICSLSKGVSYPSIQASILSAVHIPYFPLSEQEAIAAYLDNESEKIGREIELLERKANGYRRLRRSLINQTVTRGLNPLTQKINNRLLFESWREFRLKDLFSIYAGISGKKGSDFQCEKDDVNAKPFIKYTNILQNFTLLNDNHGYCIIADSENQNQVRKDDLLFLMSSEDFESIGLSSLVTDNMGEIYLNSFCKGLRPLNRNDINIKFVAYQLRSQIIHDNLRMEARGFIRINLKIDKVMCHKIYLPNLSEQNAIVEYLDEKCAKIDAIIAKIETKIERLKDLKRSLINEVVTGQRAINMLI